MIKGTGIAVEGCEWRKQVSQNTIIWARPGLNQKKKEKKTVLNEMKFVCSYNKKMKRKNK